MIKDQHDQRAITSSMTPLHIDGRGHALHTRGVVRQNFVFTIRDGHTLATRNSALVVEVGKSTSYVMRRNMSGEVASKFEDHLGASSFKKY